MVASSKLKQTHHSSLLLPLRPSYQLHLPRPYYKDAPSAPLPSRVVKNWKCWTPPSVATRFSPSTLVPCPPRITLAGILHECKRPAAYRHHADKVDPVREAVVAGMPTVPKRLRHFQGKRARNKRKLNFPVPKNRPSDVVERGKSPLSLLKLSPSLVYITSG